MTLTNLPNVTYNAARHQLRLDGKVLPTSTGVVGLLDKPGLAWGAAKETALFAVFHPEEYRNLEPADAVERLRKHHRGVWNDKANRGTAVHNMAHAWAKGETVECVPECTPYLDALERFYLEVDPQWVELERNVLTLTHAGEYGGQLDYIRATDDGLVLGDFKTGQRYPIETTLQLASYAFADFLATYDDGKLSALDPMPPIAACEVLYLHDDTTFELLTVPADRDAFTRFRELRHAWSWLKEMERWVKDNPEPAREVPSKETAA